MVVVFKKRLLSIVGVVFLFVFGLYFCNDASAINETEILKKVLLNGLTTCYKDDYTKHSIDATGGELNDNSMFTEKGQKENEDTILVPSLGLSNGLTQDVPAVSCKQLFYGYNGFGGSIKGLFDLYGKSLDLSQMGYTASNKNVKKKCLKVGFGYDNVVHKADTNDVCFSVDGEKVLYNKNTGIAFELLDNETKGTNITGNLSFFAPSGGVGTEFQIKLNGKNGCRLLGRADNCYGDVFESIQCNMISDLGSVTFSTVQECLTKLEGRTLYPSNSNTGLPEFVNNFHVVSSEKDGTINGLGSEWLKDADAPAKKALKFFAGVTGFSQVAFSEQEQYDVLEYYLRKVLDQNPSITVDTENCYEDVSGLGSDYGVINGGKWCKIQGWEGVDYKLNVIKTGDWAGRQALKTVSFEDVLKRIKKIDASQLNTSGLSLGEEEEDEVETCRNATGAKSLGWIVCPLLSLMGDATEKVYNEYVEPSLQVKPELFNGDESGNNSVREAWEKFRDIANIVFIILLMVVIFSQLTGIGIDNYGIKKILPRLIVAAILINLSYLICMIMVDLSNILGNSLREMFNALGSGLSPKVDLSVENAEVGPDGSAFDASTTLAGLGVFGVLVGAVGAIWVSPAILLSLLISGIGVMVSVFFLFILLAARKAAIIVLIAISPLAVVMYMLPNTKSLSNKWWKFFEGLLLVYPIAGLLVGAGDYVSRLLLSNADGFFTWITAMVVGVVPIFFIPMVLKSSFAAMGKVGGILTGLGAGASKRATGAVRGSEAYKNLQNRSMERQTRIKAGVNAEGKSTRLSRAVGTVISGGRKNAAGYRAQYLKNQDANRRAEDLMGVGYDAAVIAQSKRAEVDEMGNYMTLINNETRNGENEGGLFKMFDDYMASGNKAGAVAVARIAGRRKDTAASFMQNMMNNAGNYDDSMLQSIAKEVSTGENSGNYRASNPFGFEFASQINKGTAGTNNYTQWIAQGSNAHTVLDNYVTNTQELVGMKGGSLNEMSRLMSEGVISESDAARISNLATQAIEGRDNPGSPWDSTKAGALANLSGQYSYDASTDTLTRLDGGGGSSASPSPSPSPSPSTSGSSANANNSSHDGTFDIDHGGSHERVETRSGIVLPNARDNAIYGGNTRNVRPDAVIKATNSERGSSQSSNIITGSNANQAFRNRNNRK